ncbi:hypothetical protein LCM02_08220 [Lutimonas saemankumensis]|uniref:hypothetical protein n=1 Tax=Lutimonas saemankumensis TaxID=483016 RepID=UPI001CD6558B|nr:hypothetical protein [Lutimonas saemankumensis]MCA0932433.1 hypothetical protein [Lutimonas saemankumensis]
MINFFRRIRHKLIQESQFFKYLKYAIGEIILVVIGILIAFQVDTWNEDRKSQERVRLLFSQVQKELLYNISRTNYAIDSYVNLDSVFYNVIKGKATYRDYESDSRYSRLITHINVDVEAQESAFKQLIESNESFNSKQDDLLNQLRNLYGLDLSKVKIQNNNLAQMANDFRQKLKDEKSWYSDLGDPSSASHIDHVFSEEIIYYFLNDPFYLNEVRDFINVGYRNHLRSILGFRTRAVDIYKEIAFYLNETPDPIIVNNIDNYSHFMGNYTNEKITLASDEDRVNAVIKSKNDSLRLNIYWNEFLIDSMEIRPYSTDSYIAFYEAQGETEGVLNKFIRNEKTDKVELILIGDFGPNKEKRPRFIKLN